MVSSMINSIKYFEEKCISKFEKLEDDFVKDPTKLAEYVFGLTDELHKLGLEMISFTSENNGGCRSQNAGRGSADFIPAWWRRSKPDNRCQQADCKE